MDVDDIALAPTTALERETVVDEKLEELLASPESPKPAADVDAPNPRFSNIGP